MTVPKFTTPLTKAIRTGEGILLALTSVAEVVYTSLDPSKLSPREAAILVSVNAGVLAVQRGVLKAVALTKGGAATIDTDALATKVASSVGLTVPTSDEFKSWINDAVSLANQLTHTGVVPLPASGTFQASPGTNQPALRTDASLNS